MGHKVSKPSLDYFSQKLYVEVFQLSRYSHEGKNGIPIDCPKECTILKCENMRGLEVGITRRDARTDDNAT